MLCIKLSNQYGQIKLGPFRRYTYSIPSLLLIEQIAGNYIYDEISLKHAKKQEQMLLKRYISFLSFNIIKK